MKSIKAKRLVIASSLIIVSSLLFSGCSLPDHLRYKRINNIVEQVDYKKYGKVLEERYDTGDGVFSPSFFLVKLDGEVKTYEALKADILKIEDIDCPTGDSDGNLICNLGQVDIYLNFNTSANPSYIIVKVTDVFSGKEAE